MIEMHIKHRYGGLTHQSTMGDPEFHRKIAGIARSVSLRIDWIDLHYRGEDVSINDFVTKMDQLVDAGLINRTTDANEVERYSTVIPASENIRSVVEAIKKATVREWRTVPETVGESGKPEHAVRKCVPILVAIGVLDEMTGRQPWKIKWNHEVDEIFKNLETWMDSLAAIRRQIELARAELDIRRLSGGGELP
jgi:hypothetical protein